MVIPFYIVSIKIVIITHGMNERGEGEERVLIRRGVSVFLFVLCTTITFIFIKNLL